MHDEEMAVQNTIKLASSSARYLFHLSVSPGGRWPVKIHRLAASLYKPQGSNCVKKVTAYSPEITVVVEIERRWVF